MIGPCYDLSMKNDELDQEDHICDFCGECDQIAMEDEHIFYVMCLSCKACGPVGNSHDEAFLLWCTRIRKDDEDRVHYMAKRLVWIS